MTYPAAKRPVSFSQALFVMLLVAGLLFGLTSCRNGEKVAGPPEKITIAYTTGPDAALVHLAFAKGFFAEEGLDATPQPHAFGKLALKAALEGTADLATVGDAPFVFAVMDEKPLTMLATIMLSNKNNAIVARRDLGIGKPADLKGKKIGVTLGTTGDFFADCLLLANGVEHEQVTFVDLKPGEMAAALALGEVDAVSAWNPALSQLQKGLGSNGVSFFAERLYTETFSLAASQDFARKNLGKIKKVMRALIKAEGFANSKAPEARRLMSSFIKMEPALLDEIWDVFTFRVVLDQAQLLSLEDQSRWLLKRKASARTAMPNYLDFINYDGLLAVKPKAVKIIRDR